jgi:hypothetical protein
MGEYHICPWFLYANFGARDFQFPAGGLEVKSWPDPASGVGSNPLDERGSFFCAQGGGQLLLG